MVLSQEVFEEQSALDHHPRPHVSPFQNETQFLQY